jgi:hypothetical protein
LLFYIVWYLFMYYIVKESLSTTMHCVCDMATSTSDRPPKRGRPKLGISIKQIGLQAQVYDEWIIKKNSLGFSEKSNSDFANYLLRISDKQRGQTSPSGEFPMYSKDLGTLFCSIGIVTGDIVHVFFLITFRSMSFNAYGKTE